jgi:hypothetical protein
LFVPSDPPASELDLRKLQEILIEINTHTRDSTKHAERARITFQKLKIAMKIIDEHKKLESLKEIAIHQRTDLGPINPGPIELRYSKFLEKFRACMRKSVDSHDTECAGDQEK